MAILPRDDYFNRSKHLQQIESLLAGGLLVPGKRVFMLGIAGISMSGLAELASSLGLVVAGSDPNAGQVEQRLAELGIKVYTGHSADHIDQFKPDLVVYSLAVPSHNPERLRASDLNLPCLERAVFLGALNRQYNRVINIAGTNGKTTTTALCSQIMIAAGLDPTVHLGAEFAAFHGSVRTGQKPELMISEACEFGGSFLSFRSTSAVILNLAHDHVDIFPTMDDVVEIFLQFALSLEAGASLFLPTFDPYISLLVKRLVQADPNYFNRHNLITYGYNSDLANRLNLPFCPWFRSDLGRNLDPDKLSKLEADYQITELNYEGPYPHFKLSFRDQSLNCSLKIPGRFNLENALAASAISLNHGVSGQVLVQELTNFRGAEGRFTYCGDYNGCKVIADYAHHADSLLLTIEAAKKIPAKSLKVYFQPITYTRAKANAEGFFQALRLADEANLLEVYDNREIDHDFTTKTISDRLRSAGLASNYFANIDQARDHALNNLKPGELALFIGQSIRLVANQICGRQDHHQRPELRQ